MIKLDLVNKKRIIHITIFCLGLLVTPVSYAKISINFQSEQDSLLLDNSSITPREFDKLNDTYKGKDFIYERSVESSGWWTRFKSWLSDKIKTLFNFKNRRDAADATDIAIKVAGVILFLLTIYFIFRAILNKEGKWVFGKSSDKNIIPVTDIESNLDVINFKTLIKSAEDDNNFRLAIRYYYLWLLKDLAAAELISYDVEKTNSDYFKEITSSSVQEEFSYTSYLYNYIWYGEFNVDQVQFSKAKNAFINFLSTIKA